MFETLAEQLAKFAEEFPLWFGNNYDDVIELTIDHAIIVMAAILIAGVIGVGAGILTYRRPRPREIVLRVTGLFLTIPSLALYALLITFPFLGIGFKSVLVALILYSLLPIVRNTITGLLGVDPAIVESAQGMGMSRNQRLWRIELPLAWPVILTGLRVSTLIIVGIAALGAIVNGPGLGELIFDGLSRYGRRFDLAIAMSGFLGVILLGILLDIFYNVLGRLTTSKGIQ